mgnify:CR=1 FL=1
MRSDIKTNQKILVALPTLNEAENILKLIPILLAQSELLDILVIDDHSQDQTRPIIKNFIKQYPNRINLIERPCRMGLGTAYVLAYEFFLDHNKNLNKNSNQTYSYFFQMDSDFSHDPSIIFNFIEKINQGFDCVLGSRYIPGGEIKNWTRWRRILSAAGNIYAKLWLWLPYKDLTSGYKCFNQKALEILLNSQDLKSKSKKSMRPIKSNGYAFQIEITQKLAQQNLNIIETPIVFTDRINGKSKMTKKIILEAIWKVPLMRFK